MTARAFIVGFFSAMLLVSFTYFNDFVLRQSFFIGSYFPFSVYGAMIFFVVVVNPFILRKRFAFNGSEIALILALSLSVCWLPGRGLMHYFTTLQMYPHYYSKTDPSWKNYDVVNDAPKQMLADISNNPDEELATYLNGTEKDSFSVRDIPWYVWKRSLLFWVPLLLSMGIACFALALVVHRQWARNEQLEYPIARFSNYIISNDLGDGTALLKQKSFYISAGVIILLHGYNYLCTWYPDSTISVNLRFNFTPLMNFFPIFSRGGGWLLFNPILYFVVIGFAFFIPSPVSLSLGLAPVLYCLVAGYLSYQGVVLGGGHMTLKLDSFIYAGAYFGFFLMIIYTGRHYYKEVFRNSLRLKVPDDDKNAVFGVRVFAAAIMIFILQLIMVGLDWPLALLYTAGLLITFLVISRVIAETGAFFIHSWYYPGVIIMGWMGAQTIGPEAMLIMMMVSALLLIDPREALMPYAQHALKILDDRKLNLSRGMLGGITVLVLGFALVIPTTLYWQYNKGTAEVSDGWTRGVPTFPFRQVVKIKATLEAQGNLEDVQAKGFFERLPDWKIHGDMATAFIVTLVLVLGCSYLRLRYQWWPLHPVLFIMLGTYQSKILSGSFLLGWLIKTLVTKYGGIKVYNQMKPIMIGLIAGEMLAGLLVIVIGAVYYFYTGDNPKPFRIFPG